MIPLYLVLLVPVWTAEAAPVAAQRPPPLDSLLDRFLDGLYDQLYGNQPPRVDIYEQMQGDQPPDNQIQQNSTDFNLTDYYRTSRNRLREVETDERAKSNWINVLKQNILLHVGRSNSTMNSSTKASPLNIVSAPDTNSTLDDDQITEKIRSYYPSCDIPSNMDQDTWKDENVMNLYFSSFDLINNEPKIATATLRLYRIPSENSTKSIRADCGNSSSSAEEDRLLRVSIYWYTRVPKKKRPKTRLSDSKVIPESAKWVELSVKSAARSWSKGRNLGLAVVVDDQDGNVLKADRLFKGALCMVGASTPKPIPTIIIDAARHQPNDLGQRIYSLLGGNSTSALSGDAPMLPTIDVCTLDFPENYSNSRSAIDSLRTNACNLRQSYEQARKLAEQDLRERLVTLPEFGEQPAMRHIRHQRQHHQKYDPRAEMVNKKIIFTNEYLQGVKQNLTIDR